ncbi:hypothetical protein RclHR1_01490022 [Rhizophagus clarus]|uniref:Uncharacterized protein n=1 Tax=Rhizophagus clarus TaxID=94130 RepID=A0A2Z6QUJ1_9GLOM|nr:hypothetical protein RclHR1_01490022 [Rhizophagus clarus]
MDSSTFSALRINFLSSGSVVSFNNTNLITNTGFFAQSLSLKSLQYGGFIMITMDLTTSVYVNFFNENGTADGGPINTHQMNTYLILPNNTLLILQGVPDNNNTWALTVIDVPKYTNRNTEYFNTNIELTFPKINDYLKFSDIKNISINFYDPIKLSDGKLSIYYYQPNGQGKILLRQSTFFTSPTAQCTLDNDDKRVNVTVLDSVLSKSGGNYFIKVDTSFVKDRVYEEPLLGIKENVWKFTIKDSKMQYPIINSISGLLRLNVEGTNKIDELTSNERNDFFNALLGELADVILIPKDRLSKDSKEQVDHDSKDKKLLISIKINEVKSHDEKDVNTTMYDLKNMMANSDQTSIGQGDYTKYLDSTFGFQPKRKCTFSYNNLGHSYFLARLKNKQGHNFVIFKFVLIIFDFVMDILFIRNNINDFPNLYIPSLIFFTLPIASNTILAFLIISKENAKSKFSEWFEKNIKLASVFTILAGADIEILSLLHSNLAGFEVFNAPLSKSAKNKIF